MTHVGQGEKAAYNRNHPDGTTPHPKKSLRSFSKVGNTELFVNWNITTGD